MPILIVDISITVLIEESFLKGLVIVAGRKCEENLYKQHIDIKFHYNTYPDPVADDSYFRQGNHLVRSTKYLFESQLMQRHNGRVFESLFFPTISLLLHMQRFLLS